MCQGVCRAETRHEPLVVKGDTVKLWGWGRGGSFDVWDMALGAVRSAQSRTVSTQALRCGAFGGLHRPVCVLKVYWVLVLPCVFDRAAFSCEARVLHAVCCRPVLVHGGRQRLHGLPCGQVRQHAGLVSVDVHSRVCGGVRVPGGIHVGEPSWRHLCVGSVCGGRGDVVQ